MGSHNLHWEGAPRSLLEIAVGLKAGAHLNIEILAPCNGPLRAHYEDDGISVTIKELAGCSNVVQGWPSRERYVTAKREVEHVLNRIRPDIVIANTLHNFYLVEAAKRVGIPAIWIIRESYSMEAMRRVISDFALDDCLRAFQNACCVVFVSAQTRSLFETPDMRGNFVTLPKALPTREFDEYCARVDIAHARAIIEEYSNRKIILTLGTVCERKDQATLVRAVALLHKQRHDFCCYIVGVREELAYAKEIRELASELGVENAIRFIPEIDDVKPYLRAADIFVLTSHMESSSRVLSEAQTSSLPIITTPCEGAHEIVRENLNALFFPVSDAPTLATHLEILLDDDAKRARMATASRATFETMMSYDDMIARYRSLVWDTWINN